MEFLRAKGVAAPTHRVDLFFRTSMPRPRGCFEIENRRPKSRDALLPFAAFVVNIIVNC